MVFPRAAIRTAPVGFTAKATTTKITKYTKEFIFFRVEEKMNAQTSWDVTQEAPL